jgi:hypothetical protein
MKYMRPKNLKARAAQAYFRRSLANSARSMSTSRWICRKRPLPMSSPLWRGTMVARPSSCCQNAWLPSVGPTESPGGRELPAIHGRRWGRDESCRDLKLLHPHQVQGRQGAAPPLPMDLQPQFRCLPNSPHGLIQRSALCVASRKSRDRRHVETILIAFQKHEKSASLPTLLHSQGPPAFGRRRRIQHSPPLPV